MKKLVLSLLIALIGIPLLAMAEGYSKAITSGKTLGIFETVGLPENGYPQTFVGVFGNVVPVQGLGYGVASTSGSLKQLADPSTTMSPMPYVAYSASAPLPQSIVLSDATAQLNAAMVPGSAFITNMKTYMNQMGATDAIFSFRQRVHVQGNPTAKTVQYRVMIDAFGMYRYDSPEIISDIPSFVYLSYTPLKVAAGLPQSWQFPNAGNYTWNLVNSSLGNLTTPATVLTNGAYDEPVAQTTMPYTLPYPNGCSIDTNDVSGQMVCDPDYALNCLINKTSDAGCPAAYSDVMTLMNNTGADGAFVDYGRTLQPVYVAVTDGDGNVTSNPVVAVSIDTRTWHVGKRFFFISPGGGTTFSETGSYGFQLMNQVDRYQVSPTGSYLFMGTKSSITISPTQSFFKTVSVPPGSHCVNYGFNVIDPFSTTQVYDYRNDTVNNLPQSDYIYVAALNCY